MANRTNNDRSFIETKAKMNESGDYDNFMRNRLRKSYNYLKE